MKSSAPTQPQCLPSPNRLDRVNLNEFLPGSLLLLQHQRWRANAVSRPMGPTTTRSNQALLMTRHTQHHVRPLGLTTSLRKTNGKGSAKLPACPGIRNYGCLISSLIANTRSAYRLPGFQNPLLLRGFVLSRWASFVGNAIKKCAPTSFSAGVCLVHLLAQFDQA